MKKRLTLLVTTLAAVLFLGACGNEDSASKKAEGDDKDQPLQVVGTFSILSDIVSEIGGDRVEVYNIVPIGNDPHEYDPLPEDTKKAADADAFFYNGLNLEGGKSGWVSKLTESVGKKDDQVFELMDGVEPKYLGEKKGNEGQVNPHAFLDPNVGMKMAKNARDALIKIDPDHNDVYEDNAKAYVEELKDIDKEYKEKIADIPKEHRVLVTSERAYQYMTERYGLEAGYIWEIDTEENGTPDQIKSAVKFVNNHEVPALFVESNVDSRPMETLSKETGVEIEGRLFFSDELGKPGGEGDTYLKFLRKNIETIHDGLAN